MSHVITSSSVAAGAPAGRHTTIAHIDMLLAVGTQVGLGERAVHAVIAEVQPACEEHRMALDITLFEPGQCPPWIDGLNPTPIYDESWGERSVDVRPLSPN